MAKSKRLIKLMKLVQERRSFTVKEIAEEFNVSYRTMLRDLHDLTLLGVPLYSELGAHGGYHLMPERDVPPIHWGEVSSERLKTLGLHGRSRRAPEIISRNEFKVVGIGFTGPYSVLPIEMPKIWDAFLKRLHELPDCVNSSVRFDIAQENPSQDTFTQYVCAEVNRFSNIPRGMVGMTIPAQTYAVVTHHGPMSEVHQTYVGAFEWLDAHGYQRDPNGIRFELYDGRYIPNVHLKESPENAYDIWLPILSDESR